MHTCLYRDGYHKIWVKPVGINDGKFENELDVVRCLGIILLIELKLKVNRIKFGIYIK